MISRLFNYFHPARLQQNWLDNSKVAPDGELLHLWSTPIYVHRSGSLAWHEKLKAAIKERTNESGRALNANWHEQDFFKWGAPGGEEFREHLRTHVRKRLTYSIHPDIFDRVTFELSAWANYKQGMDWHWVHIHERSTLSYVYYLTSHSSAYSDIAKETFNGNYYGGTLQFLDPRGSTPYMATQLLESPVQNGNLFVTPEEGMLLIFPSYLQHMVSPVTDGDERMSIAGNVFNLMVGPPKKK